MKKIKKPDFIIQKNILNSMKKISPEISEKIINNYNSYEEVLKNIESFISKENELKKKNKNKDFINLYKNRLSRKESPSYKYYEKIRNQTGKCPYCNRGQDVDALDHYLPKKFFPSFSIVINNLVPICYKCNSECKKSFYPKSDKPEQRILHPYYDTVNFDDIIKSLKCEIIENEPIDFNFFFNNIIWDDIFFKTIKFHIKKLKLEEKYRTDFIEEFSNFLNSIKEGKNLLDSDVKKQIEYRINDSKSKDRPWNYVGFSSLYNNEWFFNTYLQLHSSIKSKIIKTINLD